MVLKIGFIQTSSLVSQVSNCNQVSPKVVGLYSMMLMDEKRKIKQKERFLRLRTNSCFKLPGQDPMLKDIGTYYYN